MASWKGPVTSALDPPTLEQGLQPQSWSYRPLVTGYETVPGSLSAAQSCYLCGLSLWKQWALSFPFMWGQ